MLHKLHVPFFGNSGLKVDGRGLMPDLQLASHCPSLFLFTLVHLEKYS